MGSNPQIASPLAARSASDTVLTGEDDVAWTNFDGILVSAKGVQQLSAPQTSRRQPYTRVDGSRAPGVHPHLWIADNKDRSFAGTGMRHALIKRSSNVRHDSATGGVLATLFGIPFLSVLFFLGTHNVVRTDEGRKVYSKRSFTLVDPYVDATKLSFLDLRHHSGLVATMVGAGDLRYLPGGPDLGKLSDLGESVAASITQFQTETELRQRLAQVTQDVAKAAQKVEQRLDTAGRTTQARTRAAERD